MLSNDPLPSMFNDGTQNIFANFVDLKYDFSMILKKTVFPQLKPKKLNTPHQVG